MVRMNPSAKVLHCNSNRMYVPPGLQNHNHYGVLGMYVWRLLHRLDAPHPMSIQYLHVLHNIDSTDKTWNVHPPPNNNDFGWISVWRRLLHETPHIVFLYYKATSAAACFFLFLFCNFFFGYEHTHEHTGTLKNINCTDSRTHNRPLWQPQSGDYRK